MKMTKQALKIAMTRKCCQAVESGLVIFQASYYEGFCHLEESPEDFSAIATL